MSLRNGVLLFSHFPAFNRLKKNTDLKQVLSLFVGGYVLTHGNLQSSQEVKQNIRIKKKKNKGKCLLHLSKVYK